MTDAYEKGMENGADAPSSFQSLTPLYSRVPLPLLWGPMVSIALTARMNSCNQNLKLWLFGASFEAFRGTASEAKRVKLLLCAFARTDRCLLDTNSDVHKETAWSFLVLSWASSGFLGSFAPLLTPYSILSMVNALMANALPTCIKYFRKHSVQNALTTGTEQARRKAKPKGWALDEGPFVFFMLHLSWWRSRAL